MLKHRGGTQPLSCVNAKSRDSSANFICLASLHTFELLLAGLVENIPSSSAPAVWPTRSPKHSGGPQMGKMKVEEAEASAGVRLRAEEALGA